MNEPKVFLGIVDTVIAFVAYVPYFLHIFQGKTKPHAFSWLVWGILNAIGFAAQVVAHAGPGAWVTGFSAALTLIIAGLAFLKGQKGFSKADWLALLGAGLALAFWILTKNPTTSVILIVLTDGFGYFPSFRKGYARPHEETAFSFAMNGLKFFIAIFALDSF